MKKNLIFAALLFLLGNVGLYAQKTGDVPRYGNYNDLSIGLSTSLTHSLFSWAPQGKFYIGSDFTLTGSYKPKNSHVQYGLSFGEFNRVYSFPLSENSINWSYLRTGLFADFLPWQKGNLYIRFGANYNFLMAVDSKYTFFQDIKIYEPKYADLTLEAGFKAVQLGRISVWVNAGYHYALNSVWTVPILHPDGSETDTPTRFNDILLGVSIKYHNSKYYGKK